MGRRFVGFVLAVVASGFLVGSPSKIAWGDTSVLPEAQRQLLANSRFVYISSQRKDGSFGTPAEIWFLFHDGAVWVGTTPQSWRAKRIKAGRPNAKIAIGKVDGPAFKAKGEIVKKPDVEELMFKTYASKYPEGWPKYEEKFRSGFKDGSRVLIKYTPE